MTLNEMMSTPYHQIGLFVVWFQKIEAQLLDLYELMTAAPDNEYVSILGTRLEYRKSVEATDAAFARFVEMRGSNNDEKEQFHRLKQELLSLGERRNELLHSKYTPWINIKGTEGLIRQKAHLKAGRREIKEEELLPESFDADLRRLYTASDKLESFRLKIIDWLYPDCA